MAEPERKPHDVRTVVHDRTVVDGLRSKAVAVDPPTDGAIGIQELLRRFEAFTAADELVDPPDEGAVGIHELLARLAYLADAGYFSSHEAESPEGKQT